MQCEPMFQSARSVRSLRARLIEDFGLVFLIAPASLFKLQ